MAPVVAESHSAVQPQQRLAVAMRVPVQLDAVHAQLHAVDSTDCLFRYARIMVARSARRLAAAIAVSCFAASPASAALGGDASSIDADRIRMQGALLRI